MSKKKWLKPVCIVTAVVLVLISSAIVMISSQLHKGQNLPYECVVPREEKDMLYNADESIQTKAECSNGDVSMSLQIPEGWEYEIIEPVDGVPDEFGIKFWPKGQTEGKLSLMYYTSWGVCGTGLEEIKITLGEHNAYQGTYDNKDVWDYICLADTQGRYVVMNEGASVWWDEYGEETMDILSTVKITF